MVALLCTKLWIGGVRDGPRRSCQGTNIGGVRQYQGMGRESQVGPCTRSARVWAGAGTIGDWIRDVPHVRLRGWVGGIPKRRHRRPRFGCDAEEVTVATSSQRTSVDVRKKVKKCATASDKEQGYTQ